MTHEDRRKAADAAVKSVQDIIDDASREAGANELVGTFLIACHLTSVGRDLVLQRNLLACEGSGEFTADIKEAFVGEALTAAARDHIRRYALQQARALLRTRAIRSHGYRRDPTWSYDSHVVLGEIIRQSGLAPEIFAIDDVANWDVQRSLVPGDRIEMPWGTLYGQSHQVTSGYIAPVLTIGDGARGASIHLCQGDPYILLDESYPETVAHAAVGRTLMEIMPHPLFADLPPLKVTRMASGPTMTIINFENLTAPLATVPDGVDVSWMGLPAHQP